MYPPTTSESSAGDSSSEFSAGPSCKRCRSPAAIAISYIHATRALVPSRANLLPPRKRFRDSISPEDSVEEDIDTDVLEDIEADAMAIEVVVDREIATGVNASIDMEVDVEVDVKDEVEFNDRGNMEVGVDVATGINILDAMLMPDAVEHLEQVEEGLQDIYGHVMKIPLQRIEDIEIGQRGLEARSLIAGGERASLIKHVASLERSNNMTITYFGMTPEAIEELINRRVEEALDAYEVTCAANALEAKSQSQNGSDGDNRNGEMEGGTEFQNENNRGARPVDRSVHTKLHEVLDTQLQWEWMECRGLKRWFEKIETVFHISNCSEKYQVKYVTCTLSNSALTWWNLHKRTIRTDVAFSMTWRELMKLMVERFQELTIMCTKMVPEEEERVEKFIEGLPDNTKGMQNGEHFWSLNEDNFKRLLFCKIQYAVSIQGRYGVYVPALTKGTSKGKKINSPYPEEVNMPLLKYSIVVYFGRFSTWVPTQETPIRSIQSLGSPSQTLPGPYNTKLKTSFMCANSYSSISNHKSRFLEEKKRQRGTDIANITRKERKTCNMNTEKGKSAQEREYQVLG
ncbi:hypothetical protein Tco_1473610 [Tanacetum coccineum]